MSSLCRLTYVSCLLGRLDKVVVNVMLFHFFNDAIKGLGTLLDDAVESGCLRSAQISNRKYMCYIHRAVLREVRLLLQR
ncbi:hypothetical protein [Phyllobacterium sp. P5_D12]